MFKRRILAFFFFRKAANSELFDSFKRSPEASGRRQHTLTSTLIHRGMNPVPPVFELGSIGNYMLLQRSFIPKHRLKMLLHLVKR
jgi:hypothetical protein